MSQHDSSEKSIFGKTGKFQPRDLPGLLASHPATPERLAWRLCQEFCGEDAVSSEAKQELAVGLRAKQLRIDWAVETILRSEMFFSTANLMSRIADPASFLLGPLRSLECLHNPPSALTVADALRRMGLDLFTPPNVGGWPGGRPWLSTRTVLARANAIADLLYGRMNLPPVPVDLAPLLQRHHVGENPSDAIRFLGELFWGGIDGQSIDELLLAVRDEPNRSSQLRRVAMLMLTRRHAHLH